MKLLELGNIGITPIISGNWYTWEPGEIATAFVEPAESYADYAERLADSAKWYCDFYGARPDITQGLFSRLAYDWGLCWQHAQAPCSFFEDERRIPVLSAGLAAFDDYAIEGLMGWAVPAHFYWEGEDMTASYAPYEGDMPYMVGSYASGDWPRVSGIIRGIQERGVRFWWDKGNQPAVAFADNIARHIEGAAAMMLFVSPKSVQSTWVQREVVYAAENNIPIYPVYLEPTVLNHTMKIYLCPFHKIDCYKFRTRKDFLEEIAKSLPNATKDLEFLQIE